MNRPILCLLACVLSVLCVYADLPQHCRMRPRILHSKTFFVALCITKRYHSLARSLQISTTRFLLMNSFGFLCESQLRTIIAFTSLVRVFAGGPQQKQIHFHHIRYGCFEAVLYCCQRSNDNYTKNRRIAMNE